jgi:hypothetical protein
MKVTIKQLETATGTLSNPSKMPGFGYGIPARHCITGGRLRKVDCSVCSHCYGCKGRYVFKSVVAAQDRRFASLADLEVWTANMTALISRKLEKKEKVFRWHDSGDIQSAEHLSAIVQIARNLPAIQFWLPTKEYGIVRRWLRSHRMPSNLVIRVSAPMVGESLQAIPGTVSSTVQTGKGFVCPAPDQNNECQDCRACWNKNVKSVDYHKQ